MTPLALYYAPDTCARVSMIALEEAGAVYDARLVSFARGDHRSDAFLKINPRGKVPALLVGERALTENVAIVTWLDKRFPEASLLPRTEDILVAAHILADLSWCSSGLHPLVTRMRLPQFFCSLPEARQNVRDLAERAMRVELDRIESRLAEGAWWYGDTWSIVDAYINWVWFRVTGVSISPAEFPRLKDHDQRLAERPAVKRTLQRHAAAAKQLADLGLTVNLDTFSAQASVRQ